METNKEVLLQIWEYSNKKEGCMPDGCSLHINFENRLLFIENILKVRNNKIPIKYERPIGNYIKVNIIDNNLYKIILEKGNLRLKQNEFRNLIDLKKIKYEEMYNN